MKTRADIVQTLGELDPADRKWIVDRLSVPARHALLDDRDGKNASRSQNSTPSPQLAAPGSRASVQSPLQVAVSVIENASLNSIAAALSPEPTWVIHALLQYQTWAWREALLRALSPRVRSELSQLDAGAVRYSAKAIELLLIALAPKVQSSAAAADGEPQATSRFDKLVGSFGAKFSRQRLRLRT